MRGLKFAKTEMRYRQIGHAMEMERGLELGDSRQTRGGVRATMRCWLKGRNRLPMWQAKLLIKSLLFTLGILFGKHRRNL